MLNAAGYLITGYAQHIFDVTNTSTHKVKFVYYTSTAATLRGKYSNRNWCNVHSFRRYIKWVEIIYKKHYQLLMVVIGMVGKKKMIMEIKFLTKIVCNINILKLLKKVQQCQVKLTLMQKYKKLKDADTARANAATSGKAKLKAGEALTDAEIAALFGG
jgi:hypothetical protein